MAEGDLYVVYRDHFFHPGEGAKVSAYNYTHDTPEALKGAKKNANGDITILARGVTAAWAKKIVAALYEGDAHVNPKGRMKKRGKKKVNQAVARAMGINPPYRVGDAIVVSLKGDVYFGQRGKVKLVYPDGGLFVHLDDGTKTWFAPKDVRHVSAPRVKDNPFVTILANPRGGKRKSKSGLPYLHPVFSEKKSWERIRETGRMLLAGADVEVYARHLLSIADEMLTQLNHYGHVNPPARGGKVMGDVTKVLYIHVADGEPYQHVFPKREGHPQLLAMPDGSLRIEHRSRR